MNKNFLPLTEIPPPHQPVHFHQDGRRHMEDDCLKKPEGKEVWEGGKVHIAQDYYDDAGMRTVATIIFPDHIDRKFCFYLNEITSQEIAYFVWLVMAGYSSKSRSSFQIDFFSHHCNYEIS